MRFPALIILLLAVIGSITGCGKQYSQAAVPTTSERPIGKMIPIAVPLGLPPVPIPANNPETVESIELGRKLFFDKQLSRDHSIACASCHNPTMSFTDGRNHSIGVDGKNGVRNAPTVINAAYTPFQFWDGRASSLEEQAAGPIANPVEMDQAHDIWVSNLDADASYQIAFQRAFGPGPATLGKVEKALASFERTLISGKSPFDRYEYGGEKKALSASAIRGFAVFANPKRGNCTACHLVGRKYALFTDGMFHNTGAGVDGTGALTDLGRFNETKRESDKGAFKTPTLRNVALTAPYMHDGSLKTLADVIYFYAGGGNSNPGLDKEMKTIELSGQERADLVAFLESLTGEMPAAVEPSSMAQTKGAR